MSKNPFFAVQNKNGVVICYQAAKNAKQAIEFAKIYGHKQAVAAFAI